MSKKKSERIISCPNCNAVIGSETLEITKSKLLLVEGRDEEEFFNAFLKHLNIIDVQVAGIGGKYNMRPRLKALSKDKGFVQVASMGVVRDADTNPQGAFESIKDALITAGLPHPERALKQAQGPPKVIAMIMPSHERQGALEDLCLDSVNDDPAMVCVNDYFKCLGNGPQKLPKAKVRVFLSSREDPTLPLGIAARKGYWPLGSNTFSTIIQFLQTL